MVLILRSLKDGAALRQAGTSPPGTSIGNLASRGPRAWLLFHVPGPSARACGSLLLCRSPRTLPDLRSGVAPFARLPGAPPFSTPAATWPASRRLARLGNAPKQDGRSMSNTVRYDDRTPRLFFLAAVVWAVVGMLVGVLIAAMLFLPGLNLAPFLTFGQAPAAPHERGHLRVLREHHLRRHLPLDAAAAEDAALQRRPLEDPLLGLAAPDRGRGARARHRPHAGQGVRRAARGSSTSSSRSSG